MFSVRFRGDKDEIERFAAWVREHDGDVQLQGSKDRGEFTDVYGIIAMPGGPPARPAWTARPNPRRRPR